jgi:DNA-binding MarR family transcriptional regulator
MPARSRRAAKSSSWPLFLRAQALLIGAMEERLKAVALPPLEWYDVLWALERAPDQRLRMHALADQLVLTRFNVTRLVDRLQAAGLVARERTSEDGRGACAVLTDKGRDLRRRMWPVYRAAIDELFERRLGAGDHAALQRMLRVLVDANRPPGRRPEDAGDA